MNQSAQPDPKPGPLANQRWLVVLPSWVGDAVMATPLLDAMRRAVGNEGRLVAYLRPGLDEVFAGCNLFDQIIVGRPDGLLGPWRESRRLGRCRCDHALLLPNSFRLALTTRLSKMKTRVGYDRDGRGFLLTDPVDCPMPGGWRDPISAVDYFIKLGSAIGVNATDRRLMLDWTDRQNEAAQTILSASGIADGEPFIILNPGGNRADKRWPADNFAQLGRQLHSQNHWPVLVNGSPAERDLVSEVAGSGGSGNVALTEHGVTLGSLKVLCGRARLVVTNDTGTRHLAAGAMNRDAAGIGGIVTLFGPTDPAWADINCPFETIVTAPGNSMPAITLDQVLTACQSHI